MNVAIWVAIIGGLFSIGAILVKQRIEIRNINIAVLAEIQRLLGVVEGHKNWWQERINANDTDFPLLPFTTPVFDLQANNVGQIHTRIVAQVVTFYGYIKFINALQADRQKYVAGGKAKEFDEQYLRVLEGLSHNFKATFDSAFRDYGLRQ